MKKIISLLLLISVNSYAQSIDCGSESWVGTPGLSNGVFKGKLTADCRITNLANGDMEQLKEHFSTKVLNDVETNHRGPVADSSLGLPGKLWDVTARNSNGTIRSIIKIANDDSTFKYRVESKENGINFGGMAQYLEKLDIDVTVTRTSDSSYNLKLINLTHVRKPGIAPGGVFNSMAQKNSKKEFRKNLLNVAQEVSQSL